MSSSPDGPTQDTPRHTTPPSPEAVADRGRADAQSDSPDAAYESSLVQSVAHQRIQQELDDVEARLDEVTSALEDVRTLRQDLASTKAAIEEMEERRTEAEQELDDVGTSLEAVEQEQAAKQRRGSMLYAVLYTVAGLFFVAGDVIMSREIVANALKIRGEVESWIFAVGLAMLAVLLKPAYDRLVEQNYWEGNPHLFAGVISTCALGAMGTLWVLGAFRSMAFANSQRIQRLTSRLAEASDPAAIQQIQSQIATLQQNVADGPLAYWAFALSGVLFAVAGAVCLGIGFTHLRGAYHLRYRLHRAHRRLSNKRDRLLSTLNTLKDELPERRIELERQRQALSDAESLETLRERRDTLRARRRSLRDEHAEVHSQYLRVLYRRHYEQAQQGADADLSRTGDGLPSLSASSDVSDDSDSSSPQSA